MTELIPLPVTGEALDLTAPSPELARVLDDLRSFEQEIREAKQFISDELLARMDRDASWTLHVDGFKIEGDSPAPRAEWNIDALRATLADLLSDGRISEDAMDAALKVEIAYKPQARGLNALKKLGDDVEERIDACSTPVERQRRVRVSVAR